MLDAFDYAALGHLHGAQKVGRSQVRYCGTPYKYSVSENGITRRSRWQSWGKKGKRSGFGSFRFPASRDVRRIRGTLEEVLEAAREPSFAGSGVCHDFVSITITDEQEPYRIRERLEECYDHLLEVRIDNAGTRERLSQIEAQEDGAAAPEPMEAFRQFYETVQHAPLSEEGERFMKKLIRKIQDQEREEEQ